MSYGAPDWQETELGWEWTIDSEGCAYIESHGDCAIILTAKDVEDIMGRISPQTRCICE